MSQERDNKKNEFIDFGELFWYYAQYWKPILGSIMVFALLMFVHLKYTPSIFETSANIMIKMDESKNGASSMAMKSLGFGGLSTSENIEDEQRVLGSYTLVRKMVNDLHLYRTYKEKKFPYDLDLYKEAPIVIDLPYASLDTMNAALSLDISYEKGIAKVKPKYGKSKLAEFEVKSFPSKVKTEAGEISFALNDSILNDRRDARLEVCFYPLDVTAEGYTERLTIGLASKKSNIIELSINDQNVERSKDILNKLIDLYNIDALSDKNEATANTAGFISDRISHISKDLGVIERQMEHYKEQNKIINMGAESEMSMEMMKTIQENGIQMEIEMSLLKMLEEFMADPQNKYSLMPHTTSLPEALSLAVNEYNGILLERAKLLKTASENNPTVVLLDDRIDLLRKNVKTSIKNTKQGLLISKRDWQKKEASINARMGQIPRQEREYIEIRRQQDIKSEIYVFLLQKLQEAELSLASNTPKAKVIDSAHTATKPVAPRRMLMLMASVIVGLLLPILLIWLRDLMKVHLSSMSDLERATTLPVLGEICKDKTGDKLVVKDGTTSATAELFRLVRTNLQFVLTRKEDKVILVTSSVSGEGKSFFTTNLGLSFSLIQGKKVVVVGLDVRNPKLAEYLSLDTRKGITTYLSSEEYSPQDVIVEVPHLHPNLSIVPAGPIPPNPSELLLSDRLDSFFDYLRDTYDYIIVDTAPVGMVSDTFSLARVSDATIYLFRADYTNKSNLKLARDLSQDGKLKKVSLVMNGTSTKTGYGYGYGERK